MLKKLVTFFNTIQSRFSYRQRFLFFSTIFAVVMPFPTYWMLGMQNFFIHRIEKQLIGQDYARQLKAILNKAEQYRILSLAPTPDAALLSEKIKGINDELAELIRLQENTVPPVQVSFGPGFSAPHETSIDLKELKRNWDQLSDKNSLADPVLFANNYDSFTHNLISTLSQIGYSYDLFLSQLPLYNRLMRLNLTLIPKLEQSIVNALIVCLHSQKESLTEENIYQGILTLRLLQENNTNLLHELEKIYPLLDKLEKADPLYFEKKNHTTTQIKLPLKFVENFQIALEEFNETKKKLLVEGDNRLWGFQNDIDRTLQLINSSQTIFKINDDYAERLVKQRLSNIKFQKNAGLIVLIFSCLTVLCYCLFHVLSIHLVEMCNHIKEMAKGNFKTCFCSKAKDEFGSIGRSLDKMGDSIQQIVRELGQLGKHLNDFTGQINQAAEEQEKTVNGQQTNIQEIKNIAQEITKDSRELADFMNLLTANTRSSSSVELAQSKVTLMQAQMQELALSSKKIIESLDGIQKQVKQGHTLIKFMGKVSDDATRLRFNCAIENAYVEHTAQNFNKITREIQRFAEKTNVAVDSIKEGILTMKTHIETVLKEANACSKDIYQVEIELQTMDFELLAISNQGKEQIRKFEGINEVMQVQAFTAENIVESLNHLTKTGEENSKSIHNLHCTTSELNMNASELQKVIRSFFNKDDEDK